MTDTQLPEMMSVWQQTLGWQPNCAQQQQFARLYELILQGNKQLNLTRITAPMEFWEKHLWDSLRGIGSLRQSLPDRLRAIDIGTGAGFPGFPVAIVQPQWHVTLLDATRKKVAFLETARSSLALSNAIGLAGRAEKIAKLPQHRQIYDLAFIRAVGSASLCARYALPLLKSEGIAVLYRGRWTAEESEALEKTTNSIGGEIELVDGFEMPVSRAIRHCIYIRKV
ncbi:MAG: 16S rRNA (guanine(527)-N(7))-methyltransferase RsmG [Cyanobacteriota bacterium]|nr:16S rRNA (guanine(527)-N(7))-methyltransferase RsmG [Cyanobacteriota bacterium]